jgi:altronate dehydratase
VNSIIVISATDNVATALEPLEPGRVIGEEGRAVTVREAIPRGHKMAIARIETGEPVIKYGSSIGTATSPIEPGAHVHTHNVSSTRGRGDLANGQPPVPARLAEPEDRRDP